MSVVAAASVGAAVGCQLSPEARTTSRPVETASFMTLDEFSAVIAGEQEVTLVEFCVPSGCFRCNEMRSAIDELATDGRQQLTVRRVNLRQYPELAWEFGVTVCPSYIAFRDGKEVFRAAHPTSADLITAKLDDQLNELGADRFVIADR
ncbi:MAG: thioredoxin family protein [Planctomycetota bacterium]